MAESISRVLRDGSLEGEYAPALILKDTLQSPHGFLSFNHFLSSLSSNISAAKSQSLGLVLVACEKSPSFYLDFLRSSGINTSSLDNWLRILDCYSDPLGWKDGVSEISMKATASTVEKICKNVKDLDQLFSSILELGKGVVGQSKVRFSVAIDSVSVMLRHSSLPSVAGLINNLRTHDQVSCVFALIHSDLHDPKVTAVFEYMSSMVASLEPMVVSANGRKGILGNLSCLEQSSRKGKFNVRLKRRNGRVKVLSEVFHVEQAAIRFMAVSLENGIVNQSLLPKVQFNLHLSEKERLDKEKVVLPFEHQDSGKTEQIYDGRRSLSMEHNNVTTSSVSATENMHQKSDQGKGEIHYFRDSDDEMPDSDEDPDDDLDI